MLIDVKKHRARFPRMVSIVTSATVDLGGPAGYIFAHEHFIHGRPADQVLMRMFKGDNGIGTTPFCVLEFKLQANPGTDKYLEAQNQLQQGLKGLADKFIEQKKNVRLMKPGVVWGYPLWGIVGAGDQVLFYKWNFEDGHESHYVERNIYNDADDVHQFMLKMKSEIEEWMEDGSNHLMLKSFVVEDL